MNLISVAFFLFLALTLALWNGLPSRWAKIFLVIANFLFYGYWFPPYALILLASVAANFLAARRMQAAREHSAKWLAFALAVNLGLLFGFKYLNFFLQSVSAVFRWAGADFAPPVLPLVFPLGISFYTFQGLSYVIDVYRKKFNAVPPAVDVWLHLSFFPLLTAGPIARAGDLLPQLERRAAPSFEDWQFAVYRITRGLFLKVVLADNLAASVQPIFAGEFAHSAWTAWAGALFFSAQIACDFSGYSDIALGVARLFGFRLPENFKNPWLAENLGDFWRRWHISLTTWFRDYIYLPLSTSRWMRTRIYDRLKGAFLHEYRTDINIVLLFLLSGLWHGPAWTFVLWGALHALGALLDKHLPLDWKKYRSTWQRGAARALFMLATFLFVSIVWVPFASASVSAALLYLQALFLGGFASPFAVAAVRSGSAWLGGFFAYALLTFFKEWKGWNENGRLARVESWAYFVLALAIPAAPVDFIYARF